MSTFESLSKEPEFIKLDAKRAAPLGALIDHNETLKELDQEKPSLRVFQRLECKIDEQIKVYEAASNAVATWFTKNGGDNLNDSGYKAYRVKAVKILNELEVARENYHDLLEDKGLIKIVQPKAEVSQKDLVEALKSLADSTGKHAEATQAQTKASLHHHKVPEMAMPTFNPAECRNNPLAWSNFWQRFELFTVDSLDDKSRMGFLLSSVKEDAFAIINKIEMHRSKL